MKPVKRKRSKKSKYPATRFGWVKHLPINGAPEGDDVGATYTVDGVSERSRFRVGEWTPILKSHFKVLQSCSIAKNFEFSDTDPTA